jgi:hypothetical protein
MSDPTNKYLSVPKFEKTSPPRFCLLPLRENKSLCGGIALDFSL